MKLTTALLASSALATLTLTAVAETTTSSLDLPNHKGLKMVGPYNHDNLSFYLIKGAGTQKKLNIVTLSEAMKQKIVIVKETGTVSQLSIINNSKDKHIFVHSGDIVKGGKQDRTLANSMLVPPGQTIPLNSFCVESGRWSKRKGESVAAFNASSKSVSSRQLKLAAAISKNQGKVWQEVAANQKKLSSKVGKVVNNAKSATSLQLALEDKKVVENQSKYIKAIKQLMPLGNDTIGYAFTINGEFNSSDIYLNSALFTKVWERRLEAAAVEAVAEFEKDKKYAILTSKQITEAILESSKAVAKQEKLAAGNGTTCQIGKESVTLDNTWASKGGSVFYHNSVISSKGIDLKAKPKAQNRAANQVQQIEPQDDNNLPRQQK